MFQKLKNKLRSRTGASISFALLLFLVCAALCSVLLTAATASSGRLSKTAEMDQRYYTVTSAAELLKDLIDGKTVAVVQVDSSKITTTYPAGTPSEPYDQSTKLYLVTGKTAAEITEADLTDAAQVEEDGSLLVGETRTTATLINNAAYNAYRSTPVSARALTLSTTVGDALALDDDPLAAAITETQDAAGNLTFTVKNANGEPFTLTAKFGAEPDGDAYTRSVDGDSVPVGTSSYTITTETTVTTIKTLTWTLTSVEIDT